MILDKHTDVICDCRAFIRSQYEFMARLKKSNKGLISIYAECSLNKKIDEVKSDIYRAINMHNSAYVCLKRWGQLVNAYSSAIKRNKFDIDSYYCIVDLYATLANCDKENSVKYHKEANGYYTEALDMVGSMNVPQFIKELQLIADRMQELKDAYMPITAQPKVVKEVFLNPANFSPEISAMSSQLSS